MVDERLSSAGNLRFRWHPLAPGFANYRWPTVAEMNAGFDLTDAMPWEDYAFGVQASETSDQPPVSAKSSVAQRTQANYGGSVSFWYPGYYDDDSNVLSQAYDLLDEPRTAGFISTSVDGEIGESGQPAGDHSYANGDLVSVYRVMTDAWDDMTEGDDPYRYTINFLKNGNLAHYTVVSTAAPVLSTTATLALGVGDAELVEGTVNGRRYTRGIVWTSSDPDVATVSANGVVVGVSAGTATITGTLPGTTAPVTDTTTVTVS